MVINILIFQNIILIFKNNINFEIKKSKKTLYFNQ